MDRDLGPKLSEEEVEKLRQVCQLLDEFVDTLKPNYRAGTVSAALIHYVSNWNACSEDPERTLKLSTNQIEYYTRRMVELKRAEVRH